MLHFNADCDVTEETKILGFYTIFNTGNHMEQHIDIRLFSLDVNKIISHEKSTKVKTMARIFKMQKKITAIHKTNLRHKTLWNFCFDMSFTM